MHFCLPPVYCDIYQWNNEDNEENQGEISFLDRGVPAAEVGHTLLRHVGRCLGCEGEQIRDRRDQRQQPGGQNKPDKIR